MRANLLVPSKNYKAAMDYTDKKVKYERLGEYNVSCMHCGALHFPEERVQNDYGKDSFYKCCAHGKIELEDENIPRGKSFYKKNIFKLKK